MANQKISELTEATDCTGAELVAVVQGGTTKKAPLNTRIKSYLDTLYAPKIRYAKLSDTKSANTNAGGLTSGSFATRTLNTEDSDADSIVSLSANQFTLAAGTYRIYATVPACNVNRNKTKLRNVTDSTDTLIGTSEYTGASGYSRSVVSGQFTIAGTKAFEIQHRVETTNGTNGGGVESNFGVSEVYTVVEIWKTA
jgi:hypothetical protein